MFIEQPKQPEPVSREMKVRIPADLHMQLHTMKLLTGKGISDTVTEALEAYFTELQNLRNQQKGDA